MSHCKILYVCQEITPYLPESDMSVLCRALSQGMQERGNEIRTFMPRYGLINERRNQLHEVIRLTNFHLPYSTQLMMVAAFAGYDALMSAYDMAKKEKYRFGTYGDAMLIL